jgi:hypothetical protein
MSAHPYQGLPAHQFWRDAIAAVEPFRVDPVVSPRFRIGGDDRVATAGSCFAQHISRRLAGAGFNYFVTEPGLHLDAEQRRAGNFGVFSARFGNLYTTRQLMQLFEECVDGRKVAEAVWRTPEGRCVDALRPQVEPAGFDTEAQVLAARAEHLAATRRMFAECDVFVFTLGLTEAWRSRVDGTVFPLAPGVVAGEFDPSRHEFVNFDVAQVMADLDAFLRRLKALNPGVRVVLTVSPVALAATYEPRHVLVSTTYSKSVLRVAAEAAWRAHDWVDYFPSYEIITGSFSGGAYFEADCRGVNALGVEHAMRCFLANYTQAGARAPQAPVPGIDADAWSDVVCDEEALARIRI